MTFRQREEGSIFVLVTVLLLLFGGISAALLTLSVAQSRASAESLDNEQARLLAESGVAFYFSKVLADSNYFDTVTLNVPSTVGDGSFTLENVSPGSSSNLWQLTVRGESGDGSFRLRAMLGDSAIRFPKGVVVAGTGSDSSVALRMTNDGIIASFDPSEGAYDPTDPGTNGNIAVNGSLSYDGTSYVYGDADLSGTLQSGDPSHIDGNMTENGDQEAIEDIDPIVWDKYNASKVSNDNGNLSGVFGGLWAPVASTENYGDLIVKDGGTYVVPTGTYRVRRFEVGSGSTVVFDTSSGPVNLIYVGGGTGTLNDLTISNSSSVLIDSGGTTNGLLTVLGENADFKLLSGSVYGYNPDDPTTGGYSQLISLGGNASSDDIMVDASTFYGRVYAAAHEVSVTNNATLYGSVLSRTVTVDNGTIAIDESGLGDSITNPFDSSVLGTWRLLPGQS